MVKVKKDKKSLKKKITKLKKQKSIKNTWAPSLVSKKGLKFLQITAGCINPIKLAPQIPFLGRPSIKNLADPTLLNDFPKTEKLNKLNILVKKVVYSHRRENLIFSHFNKFKSCTLSTM